jgi:hypothetical protein
MAGDDTDKILNVMESILVELRYPSGITSVDESLGKYPYMDYEREIEQELSEPSFDGIAFQPPKQTVLGGNVDLGNSEPNL